MLYKKFQGHQTLGSEEGVFLKVFTLNGPVSHLGHVTQNISIYFHPNIPWRLHMKFGFKRPSVYFLIKKFENVESK